MLASMENTLRVTPVPPPSPSPSGLRRSPTSWKLATMDDDDGDGGAENRGSDASTCSSRSSDAGSSPSGSPRLLLRKPPRHANVPMCAQILLKLWQRELRRPDVAITSDLFEDLHASDEQAFFLVERMQRMGFHISLPQFFALPRCCIYSVLLVAL